MKKLEPKKQPVKDTPNPESVNPPVDNPNPEPVKTDTKVKAKQDYTWVWVLIGLLSAMAVVYFMNVNKQPNGNPEPKQ